MPKRISKLKNVQIATQKQIVNVVLGKGKGKSKRRPSKQTIDDKKVYSLPVNTGTEVSSGLFVRSGYIPITQTHSQIGGRVNKYVIPTENAPQIIRSFPEPRQSLPGQEPQAYDYGFEDSTPPAFNENMIKRMPVKLEQIPIPQQGLYTTPVMPSMDASGPSLSDPMDRLVGGGGGISTPSVKSEDRYMPRNSPYEEAEFK